jgi:hypothetical protein
MTTSSTTRSSWTVDRDEVFFRIVAGVFPASYLAAATALLSSYDDDNDALAPCPREQGSSSRQPVPAAVRAASPASHAG